MDVFGYSGPEVLGLGPLGLGFDLVFGLVKASLAFRPVCQALVGSNDSLGASTLLGLVGVPTVTCAVGYTGLACKECIRPGYYRLGERCPPCPKSAYGIIVAVVVVVGALCVRALFHPICKPVLSVVAPMSGWTDMCGCVSLCAAAWQWSSWVSSRTPDAWV